MGRRRVYTAWLLWVPGRGLAEVAVAEECSGLVTVHARPLPSGLADGAHLALGRGDGDALLVFIDTGAGGVSQPLASDELVDEALDAVERLLRTAVVVAEHRAEEPCEVKVEDI